MDPTLRSLASLIHIADVCRSPNEVSRAPSGADGKASLQVVLPSLKVFTPHLI